MKKILAMAAVAALAAGASVYAANPFSDVSTSDWAYQAISDLSDRGMVEGYPDGTFKGEQNITRYELDLGQQDGGWLYAEAFDGIELKAPLGQKVSLGLGYGRMKGANDEVDDFKKAETFYAQLKADVKFAKLGVDYVRVADNDNAKTNVWGVNLLVPVHKFRVFGDYYANTKKNCNDEKGKIWTVGLGYGKMDVKKAGTWDLDVAYFKVKDWTYTGGTGLQLLTADALLGLNGHFWLATGDVVVAKNTYIHGEYAFSSKLDNLDENANSWTLSLNYKF